MLLSFGILAAEAPPINNYGMLGGPMFLFLIILNGLRVRLTCYLVCKVGVLDYLGCNLGFAPRSDETTIALDESMASAATPLVTVLVSNESLRLAECINRRSFRRFLELLGRLARLGAFIVLDLNGSFMFGSESRVASADGLYSCSTILLI